jgi:integrase
MNLLEDKIKSSNNISGKKLLSGDALWSALMIVQKRLGHSSIATTERYLTFRKDFSIALTVQSDFEKHLMQIGDNYEGK